MKTSPLFHTGSWLLERLGPNDDGLTGDLIQEYQEGRSGVWFLKQVCVAIWVGAFSEGRCNKAASFRALLEGLGLQTLLFGLLVQFFKLLPVNPVMSPGKLLLNASMTLTVYTITGWILRRVHRASVVLLFVLFSILWTAALNFSWFASALTQSFNAPRFRVYAASFLVNLLMGSLGLVLGCLCAYRKTREPRSIDA
jgi:hypothetical protein